VLGAPLDPIAMVVAAGAEVAEKEEEVVTGEEEVVVEGEVVEGEVVEGEVVEGEVVEEVCEVVDDWGIKYATE
jgi:hypothetical protein